MAYMIFCPTARAANTIAENKGALGKAVEIVERFNHRGIVYCEVTHPILGFLGQVPATSLLPVCSSGLTKRNKLELLQRLRQRQLGNEKGFNRAMPLVPLVEAPEDTVELLAARNLNESKIIRKSINESDSMVEARKNAMPQAVTRAASKQKHKQRLPISTDLALESLGVEAQLALAKIS